MRWLRHRNHDRCSIYAPCRKADLKRSWEQFCAAVDDPVTRDTAISAELLRIRERRDPVFHHPVE